MNETMVTIVGNVVDTPRLRRTGGGVDVANFRIASTARRFDRATGAWADNGTLFLGVSCWRRLGVNVTESLRRGDPVVVTGRLFARMYEVNGQARTSFEIEAHAVGPDLSRGTAAFRRSVEPRPVPGAPSEAGRPVSDGHGEAGGDDIRQNGADQGVRDERVRDGGVPDEGEPSERGPDAAVAEVVPAVGGNAGGDDGAGDAEAGASVGGEEPRRAA